MIERIPIKNRGQWLALRRQDITASEIAVLFGLHPYRTMLQTFMAKTGQDGNEGDNPAMRRGRILEPGIAVAVSEEFPDWRLEKADVYIRDAAARIGATPDYFIHGDERGPGILECKSAAPEVFDTQWKDGAPRGYVLQCLTQMMLCDAPFGVIGCLVDNRAKDLFTYPVPRHPAAEALIRVRAAEFWTTVAAGHMPAPDFAKDGETITAMFPRSHGPALDLTQDNRMPELLIDRERMLAVVKEAKGDLEAIEAEIKYKLGDAAEAFLPGWRISFKLQQQKAYEVAAKEFRVLRIKRLGGAA